MRSRRRKAMEHLLPLPALFAVVAGGASAAVAMGPEGGVARPRPPLGIRKSVKRVLAHSLPLSSSSSSHSYQRIMTTSSSGKNPHFHRLTKQATLPTVQSKGSVGFDLYSAQFLTIPAGGRGTVCTDIVVKPPSGHYGQLFSR